MKVIATNKSINFEYFVVDRFEAGIELSGCEVKSIRSGNVSLKESFIFVRNGQMTLKNMHIAPYKQGSFSNLDPRRDRKLLMHRSEILRLFGKVQEKGYTLVPDKLYFKGSLIKMEVALCKGKQTFDKKRTIKERDLNREAQRELANYR